MRRWHTFGAFGDEVVELSLRDIAKLLSGKEIAFSSTVLCLGKSRRRALGAAASREEQLNRQS